MGRSLGAVLAAASAAMRVARARKRGTAICILVLGLGIAVGASGLTVMRQALWAQLRVPGAEHIVEITQWSDAPLRQSLIPTATFLDLRAKVGGLGLLVATSRQTVTVRGSAGVTRVAAAAVTPGFFTLFGARPQRGRLLGEEDFVGVDLRHAIHTTGRQVVISDRLWGEMFARDPAAVGARLEIDGLPHEVVGIGEPEFGLPGGADVWRPLVLGELASLDRGGFALQVFGRLGEGVEPGILRAQIEALSAYVRSQPPAFNNSVVLSARPLRESLISGRQDTVWMVGLLAAALLTLSLVTVANALVVVARARRSQHAIALALGATPGQLRLQLALEGAFCGAAAGLLGAVACLWVLRVLRVFAGSEALAELHLLDETIALRMCFGLATAASLLLASGAFLVGSETLSTSLVTVRGVGEHRGRGVTTANRLVLVLQVLVGQVFVALMVMTGVAVRSTSRGLGDRGERLWVADLVLPKYKYATAEAVAVRTRAITETLRADASVEAVATSLRLPQLDEPGGIYFRKESAPDGTSREATLNVVEGDLKGVLDLRLLGGRSLGARDVRGGERVVVVGASLARRVYGGTDAVGKDIFLTPWPSEPWRIVGVLSDPARARRDGTDTSLVIYVPWAQLPDFVLTALRVSVLYRSTEQGSREAIVRRLREVEPLGAVGHVGPITARIDDLYVEERTYLKLLLIAGGFAVTLAALGAAGLVALTVAQRSSEIGVRIALGAQTRSIAWAVLRDPLLACGIATCLSGLLLRSWWPLLSGSSIPMGAAPVSAGMAGEGLVVVAVLVACAPGLWRVATVPIQDLFATR